MKERIYELIAEWMYKAAEWGSEQDPAVADRKTFNQNFKDYVKCMCADQISDDIDELLKEEFEDSLEDYIKEACRNEAEY